MLSIADLEKILIDDIINIRYENEEIVFSIKMARGHIISMTYSDIMSRLEAVKSVTTRLRITEYELNDFEKMNMETRLLKYCYTKQTPERRAELEHEIISMKMDIAKAKSVQYFFWQESEKFKAGLSRIPQGRSKRQAEKPGHEIIDLKNSQVATARSRKRFTQKEIENIIPKWIDGVLRVYCEATHSITATNAFKIYAGRTKNLFGREYSWATIRNKFYEYGANFSDKYISERNIVD